MRLEHCAWEKEILQSLAVGESAELQEHLAHCPLCRESVFLYRWMNRFQKVSAGGKMTGKKLPSAEFLWERAFSIQIPDKELVTKALRPLAIYRVLAGAAAMIGFFILIFSNLPQIQTFLKTSPVMDMVSSTWSSLEKTFPFLFLPMVFGFVTLVIFTVITAFNPRNPAVPQKKLL
jgi:hypothetical protein